MTEWGVLRRGGRYAYARRSERSEESDLYGE